MKNMYESFTEEDLRDISERVWLDLDEDNVNTLGEFTDLFIKYARESVDSREVEASEGYSDTFGH